MTIDIYMEEGRKGSNPGGLCSIQIPNNKPHKCYLKYCNSANLDPKVPLSSKEQPIYEVLTGILLRKFGLKTIDSMILDNREQEAHFILMSNYKDNIINFNQNYYFVSKWLEGEQSKNDSKAIEILANDKIYRDLLALGDVSGCRQNVYFLSDESEIIYLDLGCSFVDSLSGILSQRSHVRKLDLNKKNVKNSRKVLDKYSLDANSGCISLGSIIDELPKTDIRLVNNKFAKLSEFLNKEAIDYISDLYSVKMAQVVKEYKSDSRLLKHQ